MLWLPLKQIRHGDNVEVPPFNAAIQRINDITPRSSASVRVHPLGNGTAFDVDAAKGGSTMAAAATMPPFWVYCDTATTVKVTAGLILYPFGLLFIQMPDSSAMTVADGDYVWLERTGDATWAYGHGAAEPTDKMSITLAEITIAGSVITISRGWNGGDITLPASFPVTLWEDGLGSAGSGSAYCTFTYAVWLMDGTLLADSGATPQNSAARIVMGLCTAADKGTAHFLDTGAIELWDCNEKHTQCTGVCSS
ncbi:MAG: hypothetical protein ABSA97_07375 [Verrucomicrobiia bacterium]